MPSKDRIRRRFFEMISFSKPKHREIIDHHARLQPQYIVQQPRIVHTPITTTTTTNPIQDVEIYGFTKEGSGPGKNECQDTLSILYNIAHHTHFFAVYDGHGPNGKSVSNFVNKAIASSLTRHAIEMEQAIDMGSPGTFFNTMLKSTDNKLMHSSINVANSGSTCISVLVSNNRCYIANVGDSRAVLCRQTELGRVSVLDLSTDHKPTRQDEQSRILQAGGIIEPMYFNGQPVGPLRVWNKAKESGLAMTRALGDSKGKQVGLTCEPEVTQLDLGADDKFIIIASDGLWDAMTSKDAVSYIVNYLAAGRAKSEAARALTLEARARWAKTELYQESHYCDDITVVIAFLRYHPPEPTPVTMVDPQAQGPVYMP